VDLSPVRTTRPTAVPPVRPVPSPEASELVSAPVRAVSAPTSRTDALPPVSRPRAVPDGTEARGFALYIGLDEAKAAASGIELSQLVTALKALVNELAPGAEAHASVALA